MLIKDNNIYIRQSWLGDALMCMERGRLAMKEPTWSIGSDATMLGTGVHTAIELFINNNGAVSLDDMKDEMRVDINSSEEKFKWTSMETYEDIFKMGDKLIKAWWDDIRKHVPLGGVVEQKFTVPIGMLDVDDKKYFLHYSGTMDYVAPDGIIWDWKTAARKYSQLEKQKQSIQASVYANAAVKLGLSPGFPVSFNFGVMTKAAKSEGQIITVYRTEAHSKWIETQTRNLVASALRMGQENSWPQVDQHNLCSERWCSWWSICKGAHLSAFDNTATATTITK
jgi:hypothetical protein